MNTVIETGDRVRVSVTRAGCHFRNFTGRAVKWNEITGLLGVLEDGKTKPNYYSSNSVRLLKKA